MSKHIRSWNKNKFEQKLSIGCGLGEGKEYKPWIIIQDFSSQGMVSRVRSHKTGRVHHFLSRNELYYFYALEWSDKVLDIREQFPLLDIELAMDIAKKSGIKYPRDKQSNFPYVLTCDFMITGTDGLKARTIKSSQELTNKRILEKLEIERRYWETFGIDWAIVTEKEISVNRAKNIEWLHTAAEIPEELKDKQYIDAIFEKVENISIFQTAKDIDKQFNLKSGSGLLIVKYLLWNKLMNINLNECLYSY